MKNKIKPFIKRLILENIFYIFGNVFIFILIVVVVKIGLTENFSYDKKIAILKIELNTLQNSARLSADIPSSEALEEDIKLLNALIPNIEDYFSIIYALEKLSQKSNFTITEYTVNLQNSTSEKLKLVVSGTGNSQSFINFLKIYNFGGGRLITSDKIKLDPNFFGSIKVDLTFYNKSALTEKKIESTVNNNIFKEIETLKNKVSFTFYSNSEVGDPSSDYPRKNNPF